MTAQPSNIDTQAEARLTDTELNAVIGAQQKFRYETTNGRTYAIGRVNGTTVAVRVD
jgi:hypothetical protein